MISQRFVEGTVNRPDFFIRSGWVWGLVVGPGFELVVVLELGGWDVAELAVQPAVVEAAAV